MARFKRLRSFGSRVRKAYSGYRQKRRSRRAARRSRPRQKRSMMKKKVFGLPVWLLAIAAFIGSYFAFPKVKEWVDGWFPKK